MALKEFLNGFEEGFSAGVGDCLEYMGEAPAFFGWILSILLLVGAGSVTLVYLIFKLFIPRQYRP